jgi:hypothetical protein
MPVSTSVSLSSTVVPSLAITTSEDTYTFTAQPEAPPKPVVVQFAADQAWLIATVSGGPFFRIPADTPFNYPVWPGLILYVKAASTSGTLRGIRVE